jgi:hypothetical protein
MFFNTTVVLGKSSSLLGESCHQQLAPSPSWFQRSFTPWAEQREKKRERVAATKKKISEKETERVSV